MTRSALDGVAARLVALAIAALAAGTLLWIHRHELFPGSAGTASGAPDPFRECFEPRRAEIDQMVKDGMAQPAQAELFRARAEALCRSEAAKAAGATPGAPPALPPGMQPPAGRF